MRVKVNKGQKGRWLNASYTVEAAVVVSLCFMITTSAILLGYDIYSESYEYVSESEDELNVVRIFKLKQNIADIVGKVTGKSLVEKDGE